MHEGYFFYGSLTGLALLAVGWLWMTVLAWRQRMAWGIAVLLFPPAGLPFAALHLSMARRPLILGLIGLALTVCPPLVSHLVPVDLGPRESQVDGERHLTLTGWDRSDYRLIAQRPDLAVLQMANPDVTDETLAWLTGLDDLRELDLNGTGVTDAGLPLLAALPSLERLRLANTAITNDGFQDHLAAHPRLKELDLRGTAVSPESIRAWRKRLQGRRALH